MESTSDKFIIRRNKNDQDMFMEIEDSSLIYKLRRSCDRIEELMKEVQSLRKENDLKNKIIANLQGKERQFVMTIQSLKDAIEAQNIELRTYNQKMAMSEVKNIQKFELEEEYSRLKNRYANCQEQNMILRHEIKEMAKQTSLYEQALRIRNTEFKQKEMQNIQLQLQNEAKNKQIAYFQQMKDQFDITRSINLEKDAELELELAKYRQILSNYSFQLQDAIKHEEKWFHSYSDLSDTVNHIEQLREIFRIRKALK